MRNKLKGFSILEILISAGLFTIVILGISQTVLLMHRYTRGNICKMQAQLCAVSYFEQLLCHTHPLELNKKIGSIDLLNLQKPTTTYTLKFNVKNSNDSSSENNSLTYNSHLLTLVDDVNGQDQITVYFQIQIEESLMYDMAYSNKNRKDINPPEGFQSLRMKYWWTSPLATTAGETPGSTEYLNTLPSSELYAIRPILPDEAEYEG